MKITSTRNAAEHGIKVLVYGNAGVGKTHLIRTCPEKPIILSAEAGLLSLRDVDIDAVPIVTLDDLMQAYNYLRDGEHDYRWICLDSVSEIGEVVLAHEMRQTNDPRRAYGELATKVSHMLRAFRDLPNLNIYFSAKQERIKDDRTGNIMFGPSMPGQRLSQMIPYLFDEVFCLRAERDDHGELQRSLQTQPDASYQAKDRSGSLTLYEPPSLAVISQKIHGDVQHAAA